MQVKSTDGVTLNVRVAGNLASGRVMVVLHGGPGYSHEYLNGLSQLAGDDFAVVSFDQRGAGKSSAPVNAHYGFRAQVSDIEAVRQAVGAERIHLLGYSFGSIFAQYYASERPWRVKSLTLYNGTGPSKACFDAADKMATEIYERLVADKKVPRPLPEDPKEAMRAELPFYFRNPKSKIPSDYFDARFKLETAMKTVEAAGKWNLRKSLTRYKGPAFVVVGDSDPFGVDSSKAIHRAIRQSKLMILKNTGHNIYEGADAFYPRMKHFIDCADPVFSTTAGAVDTFS